MDNKQFILQTFKLREGMSPPKTSSYIIDLIASA